MSGVGQGGAALAALAAGAVASSLNGTGAFLVAAVGAAIGSLYCFLLVQESGSGVDESVRCEG